MGGKEREEKRMSRGREGGKVKMRRGERAEGRGRERREGEEKREKKCDSMNKSIIGSSIRNNVNLFVNVNVCECVCVRVSVIPHRYYNNTSHITNNNNHIHLLIRGQVPSSIRGQGRGRSRRRGAPEKSSRRSNPPARG